MALTAGRLSWLPPPCDDIGKVTKPAPTIPVARGYAGRFGSLKMFYPRGGVR